MTFGSWMLLLVFSILAMIIAAVIISCEDLSKPGIAVTVAIAVLLIIAAYVGIHWWQNNTAAGLRGLKTQESNFNGGLDRVVTVYSYDGKPIKSWEGQFDVTENDQETWFDIDGSRVIIQGGIIINEEKNDVH